MSAPVPGSEAWLRLGREEAIDPDRPIIDPHHHLWLAGTPGAPWPASSDELVDAQAAWYHHMIDCFGPERCMFESNFPVDRRSLAYGTCWNAVKKIGARYSPAAQQAMFHDTAARIYRL